MKNNKKGFTLVELMAVIIILGIIMLITVPIINRILKNSKENLYNQQVAQIESAAKKWGAEQIDAFDNSVGGIYLLSINELQNSGYLESSDISDPRNKKNMNGCVVVKLDTEYNQYTYKYTDAKCKLAQDSVNYVIGIIVYFDPVSNNECNSSTYNINDIKNNTSTCYKWRIIDNETNNVVLQLDHNLVNLTSWISSTGTEDNTAGPVLAMTSLNAATSTWSRVPNLNYTYNASRYGNLTCSDGTCKFGSTTLSEVKARLITGEEITNIVNLNVTDKNLVSKSWTLKSNTPYFFSNTNFKIGSAYQTGIGTSGSGNTNLSWLAENTNSQEVSLATSNEYGQNNYGYWTLTPRWDSADRAWYIYRGGYFTHDLITKTGLAGVRPVISIDKFLIN